MPGAYPSAIGEGMRYDCQNFKEGCIFFIGNDKILEGKKYKINK
jgi:hypothetical protein